MQVYVEVSKNHGIPIDEVIRGKFTPSIKLLIMYYNYKFYVEQHEYEKLEEEQKRNAEKYK
ncbi:MAG: hypothetical protein BZ138_06010 [Methanosphaera sp. rholeuAM270]|nr:MAG: hypothetical protein BZ138_06010 [Methanosphaera sp. rholeuAM270]